MENSQYRIQSKEHTGDVLSFVSAGEATAAFFQSMKVTKRRFRKSPLIHLVRGAPALPRQALESPCAEEVPL
jgi:hypothetical protein